MGIYFTNFFNYSDIKNNQHIDHYQYYTLKIVAL